MKKKLMKTRRLAAATWLGSRVRDSARPAARSPLSIHEKELMKTRRLAAAAWLGSRERDSARPAAPAARSPLTH